MNLPKIPNLPTTMPKAEKIAAIAAITQLFKYYGVPSNTCPLVAITIGVILEYSENPTVQGIFDGIILGAITTGSYGMIKGAAESTIHFSRPTKTEDKKTFPQSESPASALANPLVISHHRLEADDDRGA